MPLGKKIKMYYDPRGQVIETVNPDDSLQTVFFGEVSDLDNPQNYTPTPWVSFSYDANDNAQRRSSGGTGLVPSSNFNTPKSAEIDALGRTIKTTEHEVQKVNIAPPNDPPIYVYEDVVMEYSYDIRGNQLKVTDPNGRTAFTYKYDYANRNLWTKHIDSGGDVNKHSTINMDVMGKPIEAINAKGGGTLSSYDVLNRPIRLWAKDDSAASFTLRQYPIYGDDTSATGKTVQQTKDLNLYGQGWKLYDEAGMVHTEDYDFKGNLLEKSRQVIKDSELLSVFNGQGPVWQVNPYIVDWTGLPVAILDTTVMVTTMTYDALNRAMNVMYPDDVNGNRKILTPTYNKAGTLLSVDFDGVEYIKEVAYDAKGQPLLTAYGNNIMTRYAYDEKTFRVVRMKSEKYGYSNIANTPTYSPNGGTRQDFAYEYDLVGNIMKLHDRTPDCGINGSILGVDALDKLFNYDPLYRVISAGGRESTNQSPTILWGTAPAVGSPNSSHAQAYTQLFEYDKLGNMLKLQQTGTNSYTRNYIYSNYATDNKLSRIEGNGSPAPVYSNFSYDVNGNMTSSDTSRSYIWDAADQLRAFSIQAGTSEPSIYAQYLYSGGQRIKKIVRTTGGDYEVTVYDGAFEYMKKVSGSNTYEKNYTHIEGAATVRTLPTGGSGFPGDIADDVVYNLGDNIGSINVRLGSTGGLIDREEYYPFGDTSLRTFTYKRYRYVNKQKDSESGLYYYGARYYASWTCRFISVDPLANEYADLTPYNYAGNRPINYVDINGEQSDGNNKTVGNGDGGSDSSTYTVQEGDSLWKIADIHGVGINDLIAANDSIKNINTTIHPNQELIIDGQAHESQVDKISTYGGAYEHLNLSGEDQEKPLEKIRSRQASTQSHIDNIDNGVQKALTPIEDLPSANQPSLPSSMTFVGIGGSIEASFYAGGSLGVDGLVFAKNTDYLWTQRPLPAVILSVNGSLGTNFNVGAEAYGKLGQIDYMNPLANPANVLAKSDGVGGSLNLGFVNIGYEEATNGDAEIWSGTLGKGVDIEIPMLSEALKKIKMSPPIGISASSGTGFVLTQRGITMMDSIGYVRNNPHRRAFMDSINPYLRDNYKRQFGNYPY